MDLRQLRYFVAIVQNGSISRAALGLNVAQPALSLHVRNMEADLGMPLLFRTAQGVQPTEAGLILMRHAKSILAQVEQAEQEIRGSSSEPIGEVRVGLPNTISQILGVPLVVAARARYPKVTLRVAEAMSGHVLDWLRQGRVELALLFQFVEDKDLRSIGLVTESLVLVGPATASDTLPALADDGTVSLAAAASLPLILPSPGHGLRDVLDARAAAIEATIQPAIEIDAYGAIKTLVEQGLGYSVLPAHAVRREVEEARLRVRAFAPALSRTIYLVLPSGRPLSRAAKAIEDLCRSTLRDLVRSGTWHGAQMRVSG